MRAAQCYEAAVVLIYGARMGKYSTDVMKAYKHLPVIEVSDLLLYCPYAATPVVVEVNDRAKPIFNFVHPHSAFYIFGPEDGNVRQELLDAVKYVIQIPTKGCMNLAATVNVVLYDRLLKQNIPL